MHRLIGQMSCATIDSDITRSQQKKGLSEAMERWCGTLVPDASPLQPTVRYICYTVRCW